MSDALTYLAAKYDLDLSQRSPIEIPNAGRDQLARLFYLLDYMRGAEIGVERGLYSEVLCRENPGVNLLCVDAWAVYRGYRDHVDSQKLDGFYADTHARLSRYPRARIVRQFSADAAKAVPDGSLDFVYIDAAHDLFHCIQDIAIWSKKVRPGGIIAGHDYVKYKLPNQIHVVQAVRAWTDAYEIAPWFLLGTQEKVAGQIRDTARSWFWVQPEPKRIPRRRGRRHRPIKQ